MLYQLLYPMHGSFHALHVLKYITFRALGAGLTAFTLSLVLGPHFIKILSNKQYGQTIRTDGPQSHLKKSGTPTMGGILILLSVTVSTLLWSDLTNKYIWVVLGVMLAFGFIGWLDDFKKITEKNSKGLSERAKMILQTLFTLVTIYVLFSVLKVDTNLNIPFFRTEIGRAHV